MAPLKPEATPLNHTLDQLLSCLSLSVFPWPSFSKEEYTPCTHLLTIPSLTHLHCIRVFIGSHCCRIRFRLHCWHQAPSQWGPWLVSPTQLLPSPTLGAAVPLSHLPSETSCFALAYPVPLMSPFSHHHLPGEVSSPVFSSDVTSC